MFGELGDSDIYENNRGGGFDETPEDNFAFDTQNDSSAGVSDDFLDTFDSDSLLESAQPELDYTMGTQQQVGPEVTAQVGGTDEVNFDEGTVDNIPAYAQQKSKSSPFVFIALLLVLAICAVGLFFYKKKTEQVAAESGQATADYFYDQTTQVAGADNATQAQNNTGADMATVDVDLASGEVPAIETKADVKKDSAKDGEKELSAIEKAMQKKKADEAKENQVGLHTTIGSVVIPVSAGGRPDPFLPHTQQVALSDKPKFDLVAPPTDVPESSSVLESFTSLKINGIMYDEIRPSALISVDGGEQLVHKGDVVAGYKVLNIKRKSVVLKYGTNVYEIVAGQALDADVKLNPVSSISNQFGGAYSRKAKNLLEFNK